MGVPATDNCVTAGRAKYISLVEHRGGGVGVAFNEFGDLLASHGWGGRVRLWNPYTGQEVLTVAGAGGRFGSGDRSAMLLSSSWKEHAAQLTEVEAGREYRTVKAGAGFPEVRDYQSCSIHPDGRLLAVGTLQGLSLLDLATGSERAFLPGGGGVLLFERDGSLLSKTSTGLFRWPVSAEPENPHRLRVGPPKRVPVPARSETIARSADGSILAVSEGEGASVWHRDRPLEAIKVPHDDCRHVAVSPDGKRIATGSWQGRGLKVWDARTGKPVRELLPETNMTVPFFGPDGRWLLESRGQSWRVEDWSPGPRHPGGSGVFSPDSRLAAWSSQKGYIVLINPESGRELARLEDPHQDGLGGLTFSPDGTLLIGFTNDSRCVRVWDLRKVRQGLADLDLDWDPKPYPSEKKQDGELRVPLQVEIIRDEKAR